MFSSNGGGVEVASKLTSPGNQVLNNAFGQLERWTSEIGPNAAQKKQDLIDRGLNDPIQQLVAAIEKCQLHGDALAQRFNGFEQNLGGSCEKCLVEVSAVRQDHARFEEGMEAVVRMQERQAELLLEFKEEQCRRVDQSEDRVVELESFVSKSIAETMRNENVRCDENRLREMIDTSSLGERNTALDDRVSYIERFLSESAEKHAKAMKELEDRQDIVQQHKLAADERVLNLEKLVSDNFHQHSDELRQAYGALQSLESLMSRGGVENIVSRSGVAPQQSSLEHRIVQLERLIGECTAIQKSGVEELKEEFGKNEECRFAMQTRIEYLEQMIGDNADRQSQVIGVALTKLQDLKGAVCNPSESGQIFRAEAPQFSVEALNSRIGSPNASSQRSATEARLDFLENLISEHVGQLTMDVEAAHSKLQELRCIVAKCAHAEQNASMEQRLALQHTNFEQRLGLVENHVVDSTAKHEGYSRELESWNSRHQELHTRMDEHKNEWLGVKGWIMEAGKKLKEEFQACTHAIEANFSSGQSSFEERFTKLVGESTSSQTSNQHSGLDLSVVHSGVEERLHRWRQEIHDKMHSSISDFFSTRQSEYEASSKDKYDAERQARQLFENSYMEILALERCTREGQWQKLDARLSDFERKVWTVLCGQPDALRARAVAVDANPLDFRHPLDITVPALPRSISPVCVEATTVRQCRQVTPPRFVAPVTRVHMSTEIRRPSPMRTGPCISERSSSPMVTTFQDIRSPVAPVAPVVAMRVGAEQQVPSLQVPM